MPTQKGLLSGLAAAIHGSPCGPDRFSTLSVTDLGTDKVIFVAGPELRRRAVACQNQDSEVRRLRHRQKGLSPETNIESNI